MVQQLAQPRPSIAFDLSQIEPPNLISLLIDFPQQWRWIETAAHSSYKLGVLEGVESPPVASNKAQLLHSDSRKSVLGRAWDKSGNKMGVI